jgi:hypothetical protein
MLVNAAGKRLRKRLSVSKASDPQSLSLMQENRQSQANAPVYQQNGKSVSER